MAISKSHGSSAVPTVQVPLAVPDLRGREAEYLQDCIDSNFVSTAGPYPAMMESKLSQVTGSSSATVLSSGSTALHLMLLAAGVGHGQAVIVPSYTFVATANAIRHCGAEPIFLDIAEESWTLDPKALRSFLSQECRTVNGVTTHRGSGMSIGAVMPVFTFGHPADMQQISGICSEFEIQVLVDAAAALGATYMSQTLGKYCDSYALSFNGNKTVTAGGGGAVLSNSNRLVERVKFLGSNARTGQGYVHTEIGFNARMTNLQAAVGLAQLERLDDLLHSKRQISFTYKRALGDIFQMFPNARWAESSCWLSGILAESLEECVSVRETLSRAGIQANEFWRPMHLLPPFKNSLRGSTLQTTENIWQRVIPLPSSSAIEPWEVDLVIKTLRELRLYRS